MANAKKFDIKRFRKERRLSQTEFADKLGYKRPTISNFERGESEINDNVLDRIEDVFKVDLSEHRDYSQGKRQSNVINGNVENSQVNQTINEHTHDIKEIFRELTRINRRLDELERK